tara:strand:- start:506 stop:1387 length:882 start_codon:yes stop_codon:yes gene_type:complete
MNDFEYMGDGPQPTILSDAKPPDSQIDVDISTNKKDNSTNTVLFLFGFLYIPFLLAISSIGFVSGLPSVDDCGSFTGSDVTTIPIETITIEDKLFDVYMFEKSDLGRYIGGNGVRRDTICGLDNGKIMGSSSVEIMVDIAPAHYAPMAHIICEDGFGNCDNIIQNNGRDWVRLECSHCEWEGSDSGVSSYVSYYREGMYGDGVFLIAIDPNEEVYQIFVTVVDDQNGALLLGAWVMVPTGIIGGFFMNKSRERQDFNRGMISLGKALMRLGLVVIVLFLLYVAFALTYFFFFW